MPAKMHRDRVQFEDCDVYRYLLCCKRCTKWVPKGRGAGTCSVTGHGKMQQALSCESFSPTSNGACDIILETARLDGEMKKVIIDGKVWYCDQDEIDAIMDVLDL
jgi:hypothetical protein